MVYRAQIFANNVAVINQHNADPTQTYFMAVNVFSDMTTEEFISSELMQGT